METFTEDLCIKLDNTGLSVHDNTLYACFVSALPAVEYGLEIRDLNPKQAYGRKMLDLVHSQYETILPSSGKSKVSSNPLARVSDGGRGRGGEGGRGRGRAGLEKCSKKDGNGGTIAGARKANNSVTCWRCRAMGHYSDSCTT